MGTDLKDKTLSELEEIVVALGQKKYVGGYIFSFIHTKGAGAISEITPLSKAFRAQLVEQGYFISQLKIVSSLSDSDGSEKYLFQLPDGERVEAVLLRDDERRTLCVSTQVGCAMGCTFCATGRITLRRNLTAGEIADEVDTAEASLVARRASLDEPGEMVCDAHPTNRINNVVYMGMGEPLLNYDAVLRSVRILNDASGKNIGIRHITISTCGIAPAIVKLADEDIRPRLAISLNAPTDTLRARLMPINRKYPLAELMAAVRTYQAKTSQRVTFEYVLIEKVNDSVTHARMLVKLVRGVACNVNLIEHNPYPGCEFAGSDRGRMAHFASVLKEAGVETTTRFRLGRKIKAACGQLQAGYENEQQQ